MFNADYKVCICSCEIHSFIQYISVFLIYTNDTCYVFCSSSFFSSTLVFYEVPILLNISCFYLHSISTHYILCSHPLAYFDHKHCNKCPWITLLQIHARISLVCIFPEISESEACTDIFTEFCQNAFQNTCTSLHYFSVSLPN